MPWIPPGRLGAPKRLACCGMPRRQRNLCLSRCKWCMRAWASTSGTPRASPALKGHGLYCTGEHTYLEPADCSCHRARQRGCADLQARLASKLTGLAARRACAVARQNLYRASQASATAPAVTVPPSLQLTWGTCRGRRAVPCYRDKSSRREPPAGIAKGAGTGSQLPSQRSRGQDRGAPRLPPPKDPGFKHIVLCASRGTGLAR